MKKEYINMNVFDALQKRFAFLFQEFKNIYISFSGGKDSGVLLNLLLDYRNKYASIVVQLSRQKSKLFIMN